MNTNQICQSCGMPMGETNELYGMNQDGTKNTDYCQYCYQDGHFLTDETMEEMIASCIPHMINAGNGMTEEIARKILNDQLPHLKRWAQA